MLSQPPFGTCWYMFQAPSRLGCWFWGAGLLCMLGTFARGHVPCTWHWVYDWLRVPVFLQGDFSPGRQVTKQFQITVLDASSGSLGHGLSSRRDTPLRLGGRKGTQEGDASRWRREGRRGQWVRTGDTRATQRGGRPGRCSVVSAVARARGLSPWAGSVPILSPPQATGEALETQLGSQS